MLTKQQSKTLTYEDIDRINKGKPPKKVLCLTKNEMKNEESRYVLGDEEAGFVTGLYIVKGKYYWACPVDQTVEFNKDGYSSKEEAIKDVEAEGVVVDFTRRRKWQSNKAQKRLPVKA